ncbi:probable LRR receptor-like serine/threonine-protein kinase At4g36180 [Vicia villosa]|uniref:probable LRR receptor-like serine/threonine-protein kinase At4g36180 n=1 Tax=Vicia villosa TaxID=3911 RepID=UPI00273CF30C|nr:probable LRR receptor-like serine/threonine-protein kinase At4g36180 [Vicia villosa]
MATTAIFLTIASLTYFTTILITHASTTTNNEIQALTTFKNNLLDPLNSLTSWNTSTPSPPCDWHGILCSNNRVHQIRLPRLQLSGSISSSLSNLTQLRKLSLHSNNLISSIPPSLSQCLFLRAIYLHNNSLSGNIPPSLLNLTNLQVLNFAGNFLSGTIPNRLSNSLRFLDLSSNSFSGDIPGNFSSKSQLQLINLSHNDFTGQIPVTVGALQQLEYLWLDNNHLRGTLPSAISNCSSMVHLSVEDNSIGGLIPSTVGTMPKLQVLSLSKNQLSGFVPTTLFCNEDNNNKNNTNIRIVQLGFNMFTGVSNPRNGKCDNNFLEILDLKENHIIHTLFPSWLTNVKSLRTLDLSGNSFSGYLPQEIGDLFLLEELRISDNLLSGVVPSSIVKCRLLKVLDLRRNRLSGLIPYFLGELKSLKELSLGGNFFTGLIPKSYGVLSELEILDLSNNKLNGVLPLEIMQLGNLGVLNLSNNRFSGGISSRIGDLTALQVLNLSQCGFSGSVPATLGSLMKLRVLDLSKQNLSGEIPVEVFGLPSLEVVALDGNSLSGSVPEGFSSIASLRYLNLSSNDFVGNIPTTYGYLSSLVVLSLSHNFISDSIPNEIGGCSQLEVLQLQSNRLVGNVVPSVISHLSRLKELNLGNNGIKGEIPDEISKCSALNSLDLSGNHLTGNIPQSLSKLSNLKALNLSSNQLTGEIPVDLSRISGLKYLNVSNNNLEGEIPQMLSSRFNDPSAFATNRRLCGKPLHRDCTKTRWLKRKRLIIIIGVAVAGLCFLALFCCGYVYSLLRWRNKLREGVTGEKKRSSTSAGSNGDRNSRGSGENGGPKLIVFNNKITYAETLEATRNFDEENVLSRGKHGLVFKASYQDGMVLSIRRLPNGSTLIEENTFRKEAESLGKVKHRNLTVLRGYYAGPPPDVRLLVYDYMPNGNLGTLLQEASQQDGHVLNWPMRHLIALGIARGLGFLHSVEIVHGDVKPQNVLFDADFEAHLSEFGLDRLTKVSVPTELAESSSSTTITVGSLGYVAPEAVLTGQVTKEGDIYSFGIVLLEILTGRKAVMFTGQDEDIVKWVKKQLQKGLISELLEPGLLEIDQESSEWEEFLLGVKVALLCTAHDPLDRPSINDIVFMLEGCRVGPDIPSSADPTTLPSPVS